MIKKISIILVAAAMVAGVTACKEKQKSNDIIVNKYVPDGPKDPIRMATDLRQNSIEWIGKTYTVETKREAADSMSMVKDETGQQYVDNYVTLTITRSDGTVFLKKSFTKESFSSYVDADFRQKGLLENVVFHGIENQQLKFGVAITRPGSDDEFIPLDLTVDRMGGMTITQGRLFDLNAEDSLNLE
jgi:hypothetical protein